MILKPVKNYSRAEGDQLCQMLLIDSDAVDCNVRFDLAVSDLFTRAMDYLAFPKLQ